MSTILTLSYISFFIYLSLVRFVYWATSKKEDCPISNEDKWNPIKWKSFAYGTFMEWLIPPHALEQLWERYTNKDCQKCLDKGCCVNCGCNTYAKMLDPKAACSSLYWDSMMPKEQWVARKVFLDTLNDRYNAFVEPTDKKYIHPYIPDENWFNIIDKDNNVGIDGTPFEITLDEKDWANKEYIIGFDPATDSGSSTYIWVNDIENNKENNNGE